MKQSKNLPTVWTSHLDGKQKEEFEKTIRGSVMALERLRKILLDRLEALDEEEIKEGFFSDPNLVERFARNVGRKVELRKVLDLLSFL